MPIAASMVAPPLGNLTTFEAFEADPRPFAPPLTLGRSTIRPGLRFEPHITKHNVDPVYFDAPRKRWFVISLSSSNRLVCAAFIRPSNRAKISRACT